MAIRIIRQEGDEILRKKSKEIEVVDEKIKELAMDMIETMHKYDGVGLAAVQVGILKRLVVIDIYEEGLEPFVLINPVIVKQEGEQTLDEGCLSFPTKFAKVVRPKKVIVKALDINGEKIKLEGKDLLAQAICHEVDHLNGVVFIDRMVKGTMEFVNQDKNGGK